MIANDYKLGWSMEEYLSVFIKQLDEMLDTDVTVSSVPKEEK